MERLTMPRRLTPSMSLACANYNIFLEELINSMVAFLSHQQPNRLHPRSHNNTDDMRQPFCRQLFLPHYLAISVSSTRTSD
jgi:hypothetical protein